MVDLSRSFKPGRAYSPDAYWLSVEVEIQERETESPAQLLTSTQMWVEYNQLDAFNLNTTLRVAPLSSSLIAYRVSFCSNSWLLILVRTYFIGLALVAYELCSLGHLLDYWNFYYYFLTTPGYTPLAAYLALHIYLILHTLVMQPDFTPIIKKPRLQFGLKWN